MGTILISAIEGKVSKILRDKSVKYWAEPELLGWYNGAIRAILVLKPNAYVLNQNVQMVAGTRQSAPAGTTIFMAVRRNMGVDGITPGRAPSFVEMDIIDRENPNWHADDPDAEVLHYSFDVRDPLHFYVYPPQPAATPGQVEVVCAAVPPDAAANTEKLILDDLYENPIIEYMLYRCYMKDSENLQNVNLAQAYLQNFIFLVTGKRMTEKEFGAAANNNGKRAAE